jgi:cytochrome oxidase assembly protein ShyY1
MQIDPQPREHNAVSLRVNSRFAVLVVLGLPLLLALGNWQLTRAAQKEQALQLFDARSKTPPASLAELATLDPEHLDARRVLLRGSYLPEKSFLLDNRILNGRVGYELLMPFADVSGTVVFVNRGWLEARSTRNQLPEFTTPAGPLELLGELHVPSQNARAGMFATDGWPSVVQAVDVPALSARAGMQAFPHVVRLAPEQPGVAPANWPRVNTNPDRHRAYAMQWFLMAIALLIIFVTGGTNIRAWIAARRESSPK